MFLLGFGFGCFGLTPDISSEDGEIDKGGGDVPKDVNLCKENFPKLFTLKVKEVINGTLLQEGENSQENPAILQIGNFFGFDKSEPTTQLLLEFVTDSPDYFIGTDPKNFQVTLNLIFLDDTPPFTMETILIDNEPVHNEKSIWIGNRIALWEDPFSIFDLGCPGCPELDQTYSLQSCKGDLIDPKTEEIIAARSQAFFIQPQLNP